MLQQLRTATLLLVMLTLLCGVLYPLLVTGIAQVVFHGLANGSLIRQDDRVAGSRFIGQPFSHPRYFWGRLSATAPVPYNAAASSGSNLGPLHPGLREAVQARIAALQSAGHAEGAIPVDMLTASGSGLDPHISPAAAEFQVARVAATRALSEDHVRELVRQYTEGRQLGVLGEPRVNVLLLNLALDQEPMK